MTGTVLQGSLAVNDTVEIPALKVGSTKKNTIQNKHKKKAYLKACSVTVMEIVGWFFFLGGVQRMLGEDKGSVCVCV